MQADSLPGEIDLHLFGEGKHRACAQFLGAHPLPLADANGTRFAVWAPNACSVSVVGDFNDWQPLVDALQLCQSGGVWTGTIANATAGAMYKYAVQQADGATLPWSSMCCVLASRTLSCYR